MTSAANAISTQNRRAADLAERIAVISDVHAEPEALASVLDAIDAVGIERIWCLGDVVGGRSIEPIGVFDTVVRRCEIVLIGHTHLPLLWTRAGEQRLGGRLDRGGAAIANPGSIAPTRDDDGRPSWLELTIAPQHVDFAWHRSGTRAYDPHVT